MKEASVHEKFDLIRIRVASRYPLIGNNEKFVVAEKQETFKHEWPQINAKPSPNDKVYSTN